MEPSHKTRHSAASETPVRGACYADFDGGLGTLEQTIAANLKKIGDAFPVLACRGKGNAVKRIVIAESGSIGGSIGNLALESTRELAEDIKLFQVRLQRLNMELIGAIFSGASLSHSRNENVLKKINEIDECLREKITGSEAAQINTAMHTASEINRLLAPEFPLKSEYILSKNDAYCMFMCLSQIAGGVRCSERQLDALSALQRRTRALDRAVVEAQSQGGLFEGTIPAVRMAEMLRNGWDEYRQIRRDFSNVMEGSSWFSPTYGGSGRGQKGPWQESVPNLYDYQRVGQPGLEAVEIDMLRYTGISPVEEVQVENVLFNNGVSAFRAVLDAIASDNELMRPGRSMKVVQTSDIYFEVDAIVGDYCKRNGAALVSVAPGDTKTLIATLKENWPDIIVTAPVTNSHRPEVCEVTKVLEMLCSDRVKMAFSEGFEKNGEAKTISLVIDNTMSGRLARWREFDFSRLPKPVRVYSVESLIKYAQDGIEMTPAGLVTCIGGVGAESVFEMRKYQGAMPHESVSWRLQQVITSPDLIDRRMERISRNAALISKAVSRSSGVEPGLFSRTFYPDLVSVNNLEKRKGEMREGGGIVTLMLNRRLITDSLAREGRVEDDETVDELVYNTARAYCATVVQLARKAGVEVNLGTGFGFNTTRLAIYDHYLHDSSRSTEWVKTPYIRLAAGTENIKDAHLLSAIFVRANEVISALIKSGHLNGFLQRFSESENSVYCT